jgi:hypothetical protein
MRLKAKEKAKKRLKKTPGVAGHFQRFWCFISANYSCE